MKLLDTVVLVRALNPLDRHQKKAFKHLSSLASDPAVATPSTTLIEFDLLLKARGYSETERYQTWLELSLKIPSQKVIGPTTTSLAITSKLEAEGMDYFDALITALAQESRAQVVTDDRTISQRVATLW